MWGKKGGCYLGIIDFESSGVNHPCPRGRRAERRVVLAALAGQEWDAEEGRTGYGDSFLAFTLLHCHTLDRPTSCGFAYGLEDPPLLS